MNAYRGVDVEFYIFSTSAKIVVSLKLWPLYPGNKGIGTNYTAGHMDL
jgi:hypothetical protein